MNVFYMFMYIYIFIYKRKYLRGDIPNRGYLLEENLGKKGYLKTVTFYISVPFNVL